MRYSEKMKTLFLDIETLPADEAQHETLAYLYARKREKAEQEGREIEDFARFLRNTSFDGTFGRVLCIGYAFDESSTEALVGDEVEMLRAFWELAKGVELFVGHNLMAFDLPFLYQRSVVRGVRPSVKLSFARYRSSPIYDTMQEWTQWGRHGVGLEHLALALGIPTPKEGIDGSQVAAFFAAGRLDEIVAYCKRDVETTRAVYRRMRFIGQRPVGDLATGS